MYIVNYGTENGKKLVIDALDAGMMVVAVPLDDKGDPVLFIKASGAEYTADSAFIKGYDVVKHCPAIVVWDAVDLFYVFDSTVEYVSEYNRKEPENEKYDSSFDDRDSFWDSGSELGMGTPHPMADIPHDYDNFSSYEDKDVNPDFVSYDYKKTPYTEDQETKSHVGMPENVNITVRKGATLIINMGRE